MSGSEAKPSFFFNPVCREEIQRLYLSNDFLSFAYARSFLRDTYHPFTLTHMGIISEVHVLCAIHL